jgi:peroxiredoxin
MRQSSRPAPPIEANQWFNTDQPLSLDQLLGRVVVIEAFQMLCPGCVSHGLPQASRVHEAFSRQEVVVLGLHCVFEHHDAQTPVSLKAFLHEYRIPFPVGVDAPAATGALPRTMASYDMQGTPTLILIDRKGQQRAQHFGHVGDLKLGAEIMSLIQEAPVTAR